MKRGVCSAIAVGAFTTVMVFGIPLKAFADPKDDHKPHLKAEPFVFVGKEGDCGAGYPAGSSIVTSAWLDGVGLPDNGGANSNASPPSDNPNKRDPHSGLLLNKNGPTPDCAAAGAEIKGVKGMVIGATFEVGYDYRNGGHCGAGAPRFNIETDVGANIIFVGCSASVQTPAGQDPAQWTRSRSILTVPEIQPGAKIQRISIIFDEGTDASSASDPQGVGLAVIDNLFIDGTYIRSGKGVAEPKGTERPKDED